MELTRSSPTSAVIVSDLDGTLLDHDDYSHSEAWPALQRLSKARIPVLLNTSKTLAEVRYWHRALDLDAAFVVENGAALIAPDGQDLQLWGYPRARILQALNHLRGETGWRFQGFDDLGVDGIATHSGLSQSAASAALARRWTEPLLWQDSPHALAVFRDRLADLKLQLLRGGRFFHVQGRHNKATPLAAIRSLLQRPRVIALGDGQNDAAMLSAADFAVRVRSPSHPFPALHADVDHLDTQHYGPKGWNDAIHELFERGVLSDE